MAEADENVEATWISSQAGQVFHLPTPNVLTAYQIVLVSLAAVQLVSLIQWSELPQPRRNASIAATVLCLVSVVALTVLSYAEHTRSI